MHICKIRNVHFENGWCYFLGAWGAKHRPLAPVAEKGGVPVAWFCVNRENNVHFVKCTFSLKIMLFLMYFLCLFNALTKCSLKCDVKCCFIKGALRYH